MQTIIFSTAGSSPALTYAKNQLTAWGYRVSNQIDEAATHILLPVPSVDESGIIRGGASWKQLLDRVSDHATILGGNLPATAKKTVDFLQDAYYTAENAAITAHCAITLAMQTMNRSLKNTKILIIGWGRIGKCLCESLRPFGAALAVATRKKSDRAILEALGYDAPEIEGIVPENYGLIINTVPALVLDANAVSGKITLIDLASTRGIIGDRVIWARGLPNQMAPEASGALIAKTALRYALGKE